MSMPKIKVVGLGGSGVNAVDRMTREGIPGVELIAVNTDAQVLKKSRVPRRILIGQKITEGLGTGMNPKLGEKAVKENFEELEKILSGAEMIFLTAGLGGGTASGGIAVLSEIAKKTGALTVGVVTLPFSFEGVQRQRIAKRALSDLEGRVDSLLCIPNDKLLKLINQNTPLENAFWLCDGILREAVKGISDLVSMPGIINVDFADLRGILGNSGRAFLGQGVAGGEKRAMAAANMALHSPLLSFSIENSQGVLLNIAGGGDLSLSEVNTAASFIKNIAKSGMKIIFGVSEDPKLEKGAIKITLIATSKR